MRVKSVFFLPWMIYLLCVASFSLPAFSTAKTSPLTDSEEHGFYYTVQKGDTLWDLSRKFFNSPFTWPELWGENKHLSNPHWIYPGQRLQIYLKKGGLPSSSKPTSPAGNRDSLPDTLQPYYYYSRIQQTGFVRKQPIEPCGHIFKVLKDKSMIAQDDIVYLTTNGDVSFHPDTRLYAYRTLPPLKKKEGNKFLRETIGFQHEITGIVRVTECHDGYAMGKIERSYANIKRNDPLMPFVERSPQIDLTDTIKGLQAHIIGTEGQDELMGNDSVVFVDKGQNDGVQRGQMYTIYYQESARRNPEDKEAIELAPVDIGTLLVLHTQPDFATALIVQADQEIHPGARLRGL
jgi:hypothetical protein